jgi:excisionase family DNA binding protein
MSRRSEPKTDPATWTVESQLTTTEVGQVLQVGGTTINNWVRAGRLAATRTPGGHIRVRVADLLVFVRENHMSIPQALQTLGRPRVLVVDDDHHLVRALQRLLRPYASVVDVEFVENGIDALVRVGSFRPNLVWLDVVMPGLDGIEVCRRLKANPATRDIEVVIVSGNMDLAMAERALAAGARKCLSKPYTVTQILVEAGLPDTRPVPSSLHHESSP